MKVNTVEMALQLYVLIYVSSIIDESKLPRV